VDTAARGHADGMNTKRTDIPVALSQGVVFNAVLLGSWLGALEAWARWCERRKHHS
jgi:hypothetical protein